MPPIGAVGKERIADTQGGGSMANEGREEIISHSPGGTDHDVPESLFGQVTFGDIVHQANNSQDVAFLVAMRCEDARLPYVLRVLAMFRDQNVMCLHYLTRERAFHQRPKTIGLQLREDFKSALSEYLLLGLSGKLLHERIEQLVTELCIVDDDSLRGAPNNFPSKAADIASDVDDRLESDVRRPHIDCPALRASLAEPEARVMRTIVPDGLRVPEPREVDHHLPMREVGAELIPDRILIKQSRNRRLYIVAIFIRRSVWMLSAKRACNLCPSCLLQSSAQGGQVSTVNVGKMSRTLEKVGAYVLRYSLVFFLLFFGALKWTADEAQAVNPLIVHSPFLSWAHHAFRYSRRIGVRGNR